jgi:hypothetical protein
MQYWWVNQNQTYEHEVSGGYLWSPKANSNGARNRFYDAMTETAVGDVVFSFCDTFIKAVGVVTGPCQSAPKPTEFGSTGAYWEKEGWFVPMRFTELRRPVKPKDHIERLLPTLPEKYSPLQNNGNGNQGVYLAPVPSDMAAVLRHLLDGDVEAAINAAPAVDKDATDDHEQRRIETDPKIGATEREALIKARIGQGLFRSRVELIEPACRVTNIADRRFLRASHIKPWAASDNIEKLDGANGLLLAPHIDHLFDKGFISFDQEGQLLLSKHLPASVVQAYNIKSAGGHLRRLSEKQEFYMNYHRREIFRN